MTFLQSNFRTQKGISLVIVVILIAVISAIVLPMARTTILEEKISKNHDWLNLSYSQARGEVFKQSSADQITVEQLLEAMALDMIEKPINLEEHETEIHYRGNDGTPQGYSLDRFSGFQFDVITEADKEATGSYNKQLMGVTYVANTN